LGFTFSGLGFKALASVPRFEFSVLGTKNEKRRTKTENRELKTKN
jgi:hypothetical protein